MRGYTIEHDRSRDQHRVRYIDHTGVRRSSPRFDTLPEAELWLEDAQRRLQRLQETMGAPDSGRMANHPLARRMPRVGDYAVQYAHRRAPGLCNATASQYRSNAKSIVASKLADLRLDELTRHDVLDWIAEMHEFNTGKPTQRQRVKFLRTLCLDARDMGFIPTDPTARIALPKGDLITPRVLDDVEVGQVLDACARRPMAAFALLAVQAGLRWGECAGLRGDAVHIAQNRLDVQQVVERQTGLLRKSTKSHHIRHVPLTPDLVEVLQPLVTFRPGLLFLSRDGHQLNYRNWMRDWWYPARSEAGLVDPQPRFHDLRHTYGTNLIQAGVPRARVAEVMGHADEKTTAIYSHNLASDPMMAMISAAAGRRAAS